MKVEKRISDRKQVDYIQVAEITSLNNYTQIAREGCIVDASSRGFLIHITRNQIIREEYRNNLSLDSLIGQKLALFLPQMSIDLDGTVTRTNHLGKGTFEVALEFSEEVPEYWRECLVDLLPEPGELEV